MKRTGLRIIKKADEEKIKLAIKNDAIKKADEKKREMFNKKTNMLKNDRLWEIYQKNRSMDEICYGCKKQVHLCRC